MTSNGKPARLRGVDFIRQHAPIETRLELANSSLSQLYTELNNRWWEVQHKLCAMLPPRECWSEYKVWGENGEYRACLGLIKFRGEWRICHGVYNNHEENRPDAWKPVHDCSVAERVELIAHIEKLRDAIVAEAEKSIPQVQDAVSKIAAALARI